LCSLLKVLIVAPAYADAPGFVRIAFCEPSAKPAGFMPGHWRHAAPGEKGWQGAIVAALQQLSGAVGAKAAKICGLAR